MISVFWTVLTNQISVTIYIFFNLALTRALFGVLFVFFLSHSWTRNFYKRMRQTSIVNSRQLVSSLTTKFSTTLSTSTVQWVLYISTTLYSTSIFHLSSSNCLEKSEAKRSSILWPSDNLILSQMGCFWMLFFSNLVHYLALYGSHWPPRRKAATILWVAASTKLIWSVYQSRHSTAWPTTGASSSVKIFWFW